ncbi:unnamed protein product, partial [Medioppia subpectinata]
GRRGGRKNRNYINTRDYQDDRNHWERDKYTRRVDSPWNVVGRSLLKEKDIPSIGYGPFKQDRGDIADRSYDIGYVLGHEYGERMGDGIKTGIKQSFDGMTKGMGRRGGKGKGSNDDDEDE